MNHEILVVEDDEGIREAIAIYLLHAGFHVLQAENGLEGLEVFRKHHPAMAVVDIMMPEMDGFTMVSRIRETSEIPVLFLSAKSEDVDKLHGFTIGADDYLTKPFSSVELVARVKARMRRYEQILELKNGEEAPAVLTNGGLELNPASKEVFVNGDPVHLTPKEFAILELLMRHPGQVFSAQQIYERIWKEEAITTATITVHIRKLREKIEAEPQRPQYIQVVWGVGYKIRKDT
ncbi:response regulator transcription factor [uncultured Faecalibaculum sp.]|uniref:response regulator transcription factor n=1 Tax=uncultured Faecalibaculum sp. TaxID=1729681 RepID=UPI0026346DDB|nr:response regulator transcription factor [uncultured Faecalibaculum sp.]